MKIVKAGKMKGYGDPWKQLGDSNDWSNGPLFGFDSETTGPSPQWDRIVSAGIVLNIPGEEDREWSWLCNPEMEIMQEAIAIHGISNELVQEKGQDRESVIREILSTLTALWRQYQCPLVCVNSVFDLSIVDREMMRLNMGTLDNIKLPPIIDTLVCDRKLDPFRRGRRTLTAVSANYNVTIQGAHTALGDIKCSIKLARAMAEKYPVFAMCDLNVLQEMQAMAHREWINQYADYRRMDDTGFALSFNGWPYGKWDD